MLHEQFRPSIFVINDDFHTPAAPWDFLSQPQYKERLKKVLVAVGQIEIYSKNSRFNVGTGFVVGTNLVMTARHVVESFAQGLSSFDVQFDDNLGPRLRLSHANSDDQSGSVPIKRVVFIHPVYDVAVLEVDGLHRDQQGIRLASSSPPATTDRDVVVVGFPMQSHWVEAKTQERFFGGQFAVKRLQPGKLRDYCQEPGALAKSKSLTHDASTLGCNSGAAVMDLGTGEVIGLQFATVYLDKSFAVPTQELARDDQMTRLGVRFSGNAESEKQVSREIADQGSHPVAVPKTNSTAVDTSTSRQADEANSIRVTIPVHLDVKIGRPNY